MSSSPTSQTSSPFSLPVATGAAGANVPTSSTPGHGHQASNSLSSPQNNHSAAAAGAFGANYDSSAHSARFLSQVRVKLSDTIQESRKHDRLADLYAIIILIEQLELLYVRDAISSEEYHVECTKLIAQYRTWISSNSSLLSVSSTSSAAGAATGAAASSSTTAMNINIIEEFTRDMGMRCEAALTRIRAGIPATLQHVGAMRQAYDAGGASSSGKSSHNQQQNYNRPNILAIGERFITAMDSLKLNMRAADELYPLVNDLLEQLVQFQELPADHESKQRVTRWISTLVHMSASDELNDEQIRQMYFDLETAYNAFRAFLMKEQNDHRTYGEDEARKQ